MESYLLISVPINTDMTASGKIVLIIDDDEQIIHVVSLVLESNGYKVISDSTGNLDVLRTNPYPDLILLDCRIGMRSGAKICETLKKEPVTQSIPIVLISAEHNIVELAKDASADDYLPKPFDLEALLEKVRYHIYKATNSDHIKLQLADQ